MEIRTITKDVVERLCVVYGKEPSKNLLETWEMALYDLSNAQIAFGLKRSITEHLSGFMPTPAQFRVYATTEVGQSLEDEAQQAWHLLVSTIARKGAYKSIFWANTLIAEFVKKQGGWPTVCRWDEEELTWKRKEFLAEYQVYRQSNKSFENLCPGVIDGVNRQAIKEERIKPEIEFIGFKPQEIALLETKAKEQLLGISQSNVIDMDHFRKKQELLVRANSAPTHKEQLKTN